MNKIKQLFSEVKSVFAKIHIKQLVITTLFWILVINLAFNPLGVRNYSFKQFIISVDKENYLLSIQTDSKYTIEELKQIFDKYSYNAIKEIADDENILNGMFNSTMFNIEEYTIPDLKSFDNNGVYQTLFYEFTKDDKRYLSKKFIKEKGLSTEFVNYVRGITKDGESTHLSSSLYSLQKEYENANNKN